MKKAKIFSYPILYWIIFVIVPFFVAYNLEKYNSASNIPEIIGSYIVLVAPFLFFVPYKLIKFKNLNQKLKFIVFGAIIPYFILYIFLYIEIRKNLNLSF
jgi:phosphatidylserine synthase